MKILTTATNKIISFGDFVFPKGEEQVVNLDVDNKELTIANILEIAKVNEIEITAKKKADIISQIHDHLVENKYTEVNTMSDLEKFENVVLEGFEAEKTDEDIFRELFEAGCAFKDIKKTFNEIVSKHKLRLTPKERKEKAAEFLEGYVPEDVESHLAKVSALADYLKVSSTQAGATMRAWAKDNDIELPKAPKKPKTEPGFRGKQKIVNDWILENKNATFEEIEAFAKSAIPETKTGKDNSHSYAVAGYNCMLFAKQYAGEITEAETAEMDA